ncbi:TMEM164 family acyltransferase [Streptobacillus canis]|uniref:TMEM164 family acyltransferase n=1 Tax=Streptobacillus canis TaxID=2678686 RepID=UPI0012E1B4C8|nr:YwaF family protein [Streptobacillus canis]
MNIFVKGNYIMYMLAKDHIFSLILSLAISSIFIIIPMFLKKKNKKNYFSILAIFFTLFQILEMLVKIYVEGDVVQKSLPLQLTNISIIFGIIYLFSRKNWSYNILFYLSVFNILSIIYPIRFEYHTILKPFFYIFNNLLAIDILILGKMNFKNKITKKGLYTSIFIYVFSFLIMWKLVNPKLVTNYMYTHEYMLDFMRFIKPFNLYLLLLVLGKALLMTIVYLIHNILAKRKRVGKS